MKKRLRILHTNDLHSEFEKWPSVVALLKKQRVKALHAGEEVLIFDIGDHSDRANPMTDALSGKGNVLLMNEIGYDGVTIGNNEGMTFSMKELNAMYEEANFPIVLSNLFDKKGNVPHWAEPYRILKKANGLKVGIIGVTAPFQVFYEPLGWDIIDPMKALKEHVEELRSKVDILICLSHLGLFEDERIAEVYPQFDYIIGAHTHHVLENGKKIGNTWINQSGRSGNFVGEIILEWEKQENHAFLFDTIQVASLKVGIEDKDKDKDTLKKIAELSKIADKQLMDPVVHLSEPLYVNWYENSRIVKLLAEGLSEWCGTELSMVNAGVILDNLEKGVVTYKDIHRICPHPINPVVVHIEGEKLLEIIRQANTKKMIDYPLKGFGFRGKILGKMVFDGVQIMTSSTYIKASDVFIGGKHLKPHSIYRLATLDMFTFGHLYPAISGLKDTEYLLPEFLRNILSWKLQKEVGRRRT